MSAFAASCRRLAFGALVVVVLVVEVLLAPAAAVIRRVQLGRSVRRWAAVR